MNETAADRLVRLRKRAGLTQAKLAERAGLSQGSIGNFEASIRGYGKSVLAVAYALDVSPQYLLMQTDVEDAPPTVRVPGYSPEAMTLAWLLDQVPNKMDKVKANLEATAAIMGVLEGLSGLLLSKTSRRATPAKLRD